MYTRTVFCHLYLFVSVFSAFNAEAQRCIVSTSPVATLYFGIEIPLPSPDHPHTIPNAHTDIAIPLTFADGWDLHILTDLPKTDTRVETEQSLFALGTAHRVSLPSIPPGYEFLGVPAGQTFWYYNQETAPSPGFNSDTMTSAELNALCLWDPNDQAHNATTPQKWLQVNLIDVRGPEGGELSMWQEGAVSPVVFFSTYDGGITQEDVYYLLAGAHAHCSWAFTKPGLYEVDIQVSTTHFCEETLTADLNQDCVVNLADLAIMAGQWLSCGSAFGPGCP
jgi:surface-anchored protein